jgi:hypothetical protein
VRRSWGGAGLPLRLLGGLTGQHPLPRMLPNLRSPRLHSTEPLAARFPALSVVPQEPAAQLPHQRGPLLHAAQRHAVRRHHAGGRSPPCGPPVGSRGAPHRRLHRPGLPHPPPQAQAAAVCAPEEPRAAAGGGGGGRRGAGRGVAGLGDSCSGRRGRHVGQRGVSPAQQGARYRGGWGGQHSGG